MRAVRSTPPGVTVVDVDEPAGTSETVRIRAASICASDHKYIGYGSTLILGHELAGVTADGTPVGIETMFGCDGCRQCDAGRYNLCVKGPTALGVLADGGMSEYFKAPARSLVPLPEGLDVGDACLIEPAAVAWHACRLGGVGPEQRVAVVGGERSACSRWPRHRAWAPGRSASKRAIHTSTRSANGWLPRPSTVTTTS